MPPQWSAFIHPEGKAYFYRDSGLPVVTEAYMYDPDTAEKVCAWAAEVERQAANQGLQLNRNVELFLEIYEDDCNYYLVDRATETLFWLMEYTTTELGLPPVISDSHLSEYYTNGIRKQMITFSIRAITRGTVLESYRELLHAFRWITTEGH